MDEHNYIYQQLPRKELLDLIPQANRKGNVLEIGAGGGETLLYAKEHGFANKIYGVELCKIENSNQNSELFSNFIIDNIETAILPFENSQFDVIICGDILEHLVTPEKTLESLKKYLKSEGVIIASIPNIREFKTMKKIFFEGDFKYSDSGILDKTHLRFFCKKNIISLFENQNFNILKIVSSNQGQAMRYLKRLRIFKLFLQIFFEEFVTIRYFILAEKK
ncbi:class I SAM-dependent methyltransferase [Sulfuricurvum sp.]|uniref:class I SAM-dependent methyltransferase n=1 Tax=Sulfuricurvum sp. TaxID=2025608 RepID=UPI0025FCD21B|nr:class I SAM-dependent methyltransferase [Sulfuricurvum sp.]